MDKPEYYKKNNVKVEVDEVETRYYYYDTCIVRFTEDIIWLNTGGHNTASTKRHINRICELHDLGYSVYQKKKQLYIDAEGIDYDWDGKEVKLAR